MTLVKGLAATALVLSFLSCSGHAEETRARVSVIDTGLDLQDSRFAGAICTDGNRDFTGEGLEDKIGHGTHVASLILKYAGGTSTKWCLEILKYYSEGNLPEVNLQHEIRAIQESVSKKAIIINISSGGVGRSVDEFDIIRNSHILLIAAAGNEGVSAKTFYPCAYGLELSNVTCVGSLSQSGEPLKSSNTGDWLNWELGEGVEGYLPDGRKGLMSGTSMSTAIYTGRLLSNMPRK